MAAAGSGPQGQHRPVPAPPREKRWFQERPSPYKHEQDALDHVHALMPQAEPYRAWATFSFTAGSGRVNECDLFILVPRGLFLVELKGHPGRLVNSGDVWNFHGSDQVRTIRNPLHLTDLKSKELKNRLRWAAGKKNLNVPIPRVDPAVFVSDPHLRSELDEQQRIRVYGHNDGGTGLPRIWDDFLGLPPGNENDAQRKERFRFAKLLPDLMRTIGVHASTAHLRFGDDWRLSGRPLDAGPTWEDRLATREHPIHEEGRLRVYLVGEQTGDEARRRVTRAAQREYQVLQGINHRGIAEALQFQDHRGSPAILFRHGESDLRLDEYLATHGAALTPEVRLDLVRQLADALRHAHGRSLYHRALAARSVYVACRADGSSPVLRVIDWQVAARDFDTTTPSIGDSSIHEEHVADSARLYLAPEFDERYADPGDLDLFGLGAVSYLVLTGQPPAVGRSELLQRLRADGGLRPRAVTDGVPEEIDELVFAVTRVHVDDRAESVEWFVAGLDRFDQQRAVEEETPTGVDPLSAKAGQEVDGGVVWRVLGTGGTSRVLLVRREGVDAEGEPRSEDRVLKVALDEERAARLRDEADALRRVDGGHVVRLLGAPRQVHGHTVLELEFAGEKSLGGKLREEGPLTYHELRRFGDDLFVALDQLAGNGVRHRDIKPDNLGVFQRADDSWQLKLFDFSLTRAGEKDLTAGTNGYLDPFLGADTRRPEYDTHAELYAAAVTLHEMAATERPRWGDGMTSPAVLDDETPTLASELFDAALRQELTTFFERALHRDADHRFDNLQQMRDAWRAVFTTTERTGPVSTPATVNRGDAGPLPPGEARDRAADVAELDTLLSAAGLSPAAESAANGLGAYTVGELLEVPPYQISKARGTGALVRKELNRRRRQWTARLQVRGVPTDREGPRGEPDGSRGESESAESEHPPARKGVAELARMIAPRPSRRSRGPEALRLLLGLPDEDGTPSPLASWSPQSEVAAHLGVRQPTVSRHHRQATKEWADLPELREVRDELVGRVRAAGGVATAEELAAELRARRGSLVGDEGPADPRVVALAVVRAAVEAEMWDEGRTEDDQPRLVVCRRGARVLVCAESLPGTADPAPADLADYAKSLGAAADDLARTDPLPGRSAVLRGLRDVSLPEGMAPLADTRLVALAAAASGNALYSPRLELYPRDLGLARALRISQAAAGVHRERGSTVPELLARVRSRFPGLELGDPTWVEVKPALAEAGYELEFDREAHRFRAPPPPVSANRFPSTDRDPAPPGGPVLAGVETRPAAATVLDAALRRGGFLALALRGKDVPGAAELLRAAHPVVPIDLGSRFLAELRRLAAEHGRWDAVLRSDASFSAAGELSQGLRSYARKAWQHTGERVREQAAAAGDRAVVLLHNASLAARFYDAGGQELVTGLQNAARRAGETPYGLWLLCPMDQPRAAAPQLDDRVVEVLGEHERVHLHQDFLAELREGRAVA